ncbi:uroporphyrinogen-III synthase [Brevundimonas balnearis]|uniref:Uroporphyrinogen-III synthase n=1 Tax=Brevundimonas balnearis TaxID=1572858 RepID=A0ABV6R5G8_9CAUL
MGARGLIWVTRSEPGATATGQALIRRGYAPLIDPVIEVVVRAATVDLDRFAAVALTSAHGARALATLTSRRDRPVFTVGDATAEAARQAGFGDVRSASADGAALATILSHAPPDGPVLWVRGRDAAFDLVSALAGIVEVKPLVAYAAEPRRPDAALLAAEEGRIATVLIHSPRGARLAVEALGDRPCPPAVCLSDAAADAWPGPILAVAATPDEPALLDALGKARPPV